MISPLAFAASSAAGVGLAAGGCAYAALWPGSQIFGAALIAPSRPDELALTFDDGPSHAFTPRLLDLLARNGVRASFFLVGRYAAAQPDLVRRIASEGHAFGCHAWSHRNLATAPAAAILGEIARARQTISEITGAPVLLFRPPFGARRPATLRIARQLGLVPVLWNAMTSDWKTPSPERIAGRLASQIDRAARRGRAANVVLHDGGHLDPVSDRSASVAAAGLLIERYHGTRQFVTIPEWVKHAALS
jgi:peptidoglycan/xylan/chitin deacetylase (PgdA/CDA1 family)